MTATRENDKVLVSHRLDADQLERIDTLVVARRTTRSQLFREALEEYLQRYEQSVPSRPE